MSYCLAIITQSGLVFASDSRTNAGSDMVNTCRKMYTLEKPGERVFVLLTSGGLSLSQSVMTLVQREFDQGEGLAKCTTMYEAARHVGTQVRKVADLDREALERDNIPFNVHFILGGQISGEAPGLYLIYPQGNPLQASEDIPYLQIGEVKYGRPILDRGVKYHQTTLEQATKYALISLDSTMRSNVTVGPPIDCVVYPANDLKLTLCRRFTSKDPDLLEIQGQWERALRRAITELPDISLSGSSPLFDAR